MPKGTTPIRKENIINLGAEVTIEDLNYDECVRLANSQAEQCKNGIMVQDTAWVGYEEIHFLDYAGIWNACHGSQPPVDC